MGNRLRKRLHSGGGMVQAEIRPNKEIPRRQPRSVTFNPMKRQVMLISIRLVCAKLYDGS